jgi:hypothetical protein
MGSTYNFCGKLENITIKLEVDDVLVLNGYRIQQLEGGELLIDSRFPSQVAIGKNIAQSSEGGSASVVINGMEQ